MQAPWNGVWLYIFSPASVVASDLPPNKINCEIHNQIDNRNDNRIDEQCNNGTSKTKKNIEKTMFTKWVI